LLSSDDCDFWERLLLEKVFGISYECYSDDLITLSLLQEKTTDAINFLDNIKSGSIKLPEEYRFKNEEYTSLGYRVLTLLIVRRGAHLPERLRVEVLRTSTWEYDSRWKWSSKSTKMRTFYLKDFRSQILKYKDGNIPCFRNLDIKNDNELDISSIGLNQFNENIRMNRCYIIKYINLQCCDLNQIPKGIYEYKLLKRLNLSKNKIKKIPSKIKLLKNLEFLDISYNRLKRVPRVARNLSHLKRLNLSYNKINYLSKALNNLTHLESINLYNNKIETLPDDLEELNKIVYLG